MPDARAIEIRIGGMSCQHCVHAATRALAAAPGVRVVDVSLGRAAVQGDAAAAAAALAAAGFEPTVGGDSVEPARLRLNARS